MSPAEMPCPDPSVHLARLPTLQELASTAALYVTNPGKNTTMRNGHSSGEDKNKLSSAGATASLKYARAQDLPSFPVIGIDAQTSAGAAATLASSKQKSIEPWRPELSSSASKAALLAKDYKMAPAWRPEASAAGSRAALLAHKDSTKDARRMPDISKVGNSAAELAMRKKEPTAQSDNYHCEDRQRKALVAATGAFSGRKRAESMPVVSSPFRQPTDNTDGFLNSSSNYHNLSPKREETESMASSAIQAARAQYIGQNTPREMFTTNPPVSAEVNEKNRQDALRASALSMAKRMYQIQQSHIEAAAAGITRSDESAAATKAHERKPPDTDQNLKQQALQYINVQEAAQKIAAQRLAKLKTDDAAAFRDYYGYGKEQPRHRLSIRRGRRRASSDGTLPSSDDEDIRTHRIKSQMTLLNNRLAEVDAKKRQKDREALLAVAERKVQARMHDMDEKLYMETGKVPPSIMEEWEKKAHARVVLDNETRKTNYGKVHVGGGKYIDQSEIDAVAAARIQPTLNEINEATEKQRAIEEEIRLDQEEQKRQAQMKKQKETELKAEQKRIRDEEKHATRARKAEEKKIARTEKEADKARRVEERRIERERSQWRGAGTETGQENDIVKHSSPETESRHIGDPHPDTTTLDTNISTVDSYSSPFSSPSKAESKGIKSMLNKFKRKSRVSAGDDDIQQHPIGSALLTGGCTPTSHGDAPSKQPLTLATAESRPVKQASPRRTAPSISSISSNSFTGSDLNLDNRLSDLSGCADAEFEEARDYFDEQMAPSPIFTSEGKKDPGHPVRDSKFQENF